MRFWNIVGAFLVLVCNLVVSFSHSLELFRAGGFSNGLEYAGVMAAETTFILGALNVVVSRLQNKPAGSPAMAGFFLGMCLITWSNISGGWSFGVVGVILGAVVPVSLIISEAILSRAILQRAKKAETSPRTEEETLETPSQVGEPLQPRDSGVSKLVKPPEAIGEPLEEPLEVALQLYQENGRLPSRRLLMSRAKCKEWVARQVISQLKLQTT